MASSGSRPPQPPRHVLPLRLLISSSRTRGWQPLRHGLSHRPPRTLTITRSRRPHQAQFKRAHLTELHVTQLNSPHYIVTSKTSTYQLASQPARLTFCFQHHLDTLALAGGQRRLTLFVTRGTAMCLSPPLALEGPPT